MIRTLLALVLIFAPVGALRADNGIVSKPSRFSVAETIDRLEAVLQARKLPIFARIDHAGEAEKVELKMPPTQLLIFGNPRAGTPIMLAAPTIAIDLPLKALAWQDSSGKVWLSYNTADHLTRRHGLSDELAKSLAAIEGLIDAALN